MVVEGGRAPLRSPSLLTAVDTLTPYLSILIAKMTCVRTPGNAYLYNWFLIQPLYHHHPQPKWPLQTHTMTLVTFFTAPS